jgi:hypothetical protein
MPVPGGNRPAAPMPVPGGNRPTTPMPVPGGTRPPAYGGGVATAPREPLARPAAPAVQNGTGVSAQTMAPLNRMATPAPAPLHAPLLPEEEEETGGLADGIAAGRHPPVRPTGIPAMGTFTAANSKYYTGQVIDPLSGTHYDSATGQATSVTPQQKGADIVFQWDDPVSTPRLIGRFALAFVGILAIMGTLVHFLPDYAAFPLVVALFGAGLLLPVMRAVPFQSDDSDDLVWFLLLTLLFGPGIGLLIYSVKAALLRDMNIAVLGLLAVSFLGYLVFQMAAPIAPLTPDTGEGIFSIMKLAPPWTQAGRYGYAAMLYNWAGMFAMAGWFLGNVFRKLDE